VPLVEEQAAAITGAVWVCGRVRERIQRLKETIDVARNQLLILPECGSHHRRNPASRYWRLRSEKINYFLWNPIEVTSYRQKIKFVCGL